MPVQWKVVVVEDDAALSRAVSTGLSSEGYRVRAARTAAEGVALVCEWNPDLVLLDLMLPDNEDASIFSSFREVSDAALVGMTARASLTEVVSGLREGADDYVTKPFALEELAARVAAVLRRTRSNGTESIQVGDLEIDVAAGLARRSGRQLELTATEFRILAALARQAGKILAQDQLINQLWTIGSGPESNSIEVHVARLRRKLEANGEPRLLHTVRGMGYVLKEERT